MCNKLSVILTFVLIVSTCVHSGKTYNMVLFDVDSKDRTLGLSCPPITFLQVDFLNTTSSIIADGGELVYHRGSQIF